MKLIYCPDCRDVVQLKSTWHTCSCKHSGGVYNTDGLTATIGGQAKVFGIANPFFRSGWTDLSLEERQRERPYWCAPAEGDCWWGEYAGDKQVMRVASAQGPRRILLRALEALRTGYLT